VWARKARVYAYIRSNPILFIPSRVAVVDDYGSRVVQGHICHNAEASIQLWMDVDPTEYSAVLDFKGFEVRRKLTAHIFVVHSVVIHCMCSMLGLNVSLNADHLVPLRTSRTDSLLFSAKEVPAISIAHGCARSVNAVLRAFYAVAVVSQGHTINPAFDAGGKDAGWGYYK
ncbi:hypothetical protein AX16_001182, partial [Volvariella volvacea WC 439]